MFIFFILSIAVSYVCSLKCYCANDRRFCDLASGACNTSGICVGELVIHESSNIIVQGCLLEEEVANSCNELNDILRTRLCCRENFCNSVLKIYQYYDIQPPDFSSSNRSVPLTSFNFSSDPSSYTRKTTAVYSYPSNSTNYSFIIIPLVFVVLSAISLLTFCVLVVLLCIYSKRLHARGSFTYQEQSNQFVTQYSDFPLDMTCESGSGSGIAQLSQVTIARQVVKGQIIGSGRYGEVWKGVWRDQSVAVKIFYSIEAESWEAETGIYMTDLIRHENILGFIAADKIDMENSFQYWLVTDYIEHGSLLEYLSENRLNLEDSFRLAKSAAAGVSHLHSEIKGGCKFNSTQVLSKPCIIHRDIKSKNILVNSFKECVIADFGLAVHLIETNKSSIASTFYKRVGTKRYMSPELLSKEIDEMNLFEVNNSDSFSYIFINFPFFQREMSEQNYKVIILIQIYQNSISIH